LSDVTERATVESEGGARRAPAFEERRVGRRDAVRGTAADGGLGAMAPLLAELAGGGEVDSLDWRFGAPGRPGEALKLTATTTRCRLLGPGRGRVDLALYLSAAGAARGDGRCTLVVPAVGEVPLDAHLRTDFCSRPWGGLLAERLAGSAAFTAATAGFDGSIELAAGEESIQLRVYKGTLLEVARSTPAGPTFTLAGSEREWAALALAPRNDFIARTMRGGFSARGDRYQYVRLTKALLASWDAVRALAAEGE
jgi:hypothetical protein